MKFFCLGFLQSTRASDVHVRWQYGRLTQVLVLDAGHMVPHDAPEAALAMIRAFIADHE